MSLGSSTSGFRAAWKTASVPDTLKPIFCRRERSLSWQVWGSAGIGDDVDRGVCASYWLVLTGRGLIPCVCAEKGFIFKPENGALRTKGEGAKSPYRRRSQEETVRRFS